MTIKNCTIVLLAFLAPFLFGADAKIQKYSANTSSVARFEKFEIRINKIDAEYANPFNYDEIELYGHFVSPGGRVWEIPGFYDGSQFCVRFAPDEAGKWTFTLTLTDKNGSYRTEPGEFVCLPSAHHGRITISPDDPNYLSYSDSTLFIGIGQNVPWWIERFPQFWTLMQASGCNLFTYWLPAWDHSLLLSNSYQQYDTFSADQIDAVIEKCEQTGVHLIFTVWNAEWFAGKKSDMARASWEKNPFRALCSKPEDFFSAKELWRWQENYYKYIIARWGYSRAVAMWQPIHDQVNNISAEANKWAQKVCTLFEELDPYQHPVANGEFAQAPSRAEDFNRVSCIALESNPKEPDMLVKSIAKQAAGAGKKSDGPICFASLYPADSKSLQPETIHNAMWAALANGAGVLPLLSSSKDMDPAIFPEVFVQAKPLLFFIQSIDFEMTGKKPMVIIDAPGIDAWGRMGENDGFGWIVRRSKSAAQEKLAVVVPRNSCYEISWYNTQNGGLVGSERLYASDNRLQISPPRFEKDIAFHLSEVRKSFAKEDFSELKGWEIIQPEWSIKEEALRGKAHKDSAAIILSGGHDWRHYEVNVRINIKPRSLIEIIARENNLDYYSAKIGETETELKLQAVGRSIQLAGTKRPLAANEWHDIRFALFEDKLSLMVDDETVLTASNAQLSDGGIGFAVVAGEASFDDVRIERDTTPPLAPLLLTELKPTRENLIKLAGWKPLDADSVIIAPEKGEPVHAGTVNDSTWSAQVPLPYLGLNRLSLFSSDRSGNNSDTVYAFINRYQGELLLNESFSHFDKDLWTIRGGDWMSDSIYMQVTPAQGRSLLVRNEDFGHGYAASVRALLPGSGSLYLPFYWQNENNYYLLRIELSYGEEGNIRLEKYVDGSSSRIAETAAKIYSAGQPEWITVLVETDNDQIKISVNGELLVQAADKTFSHGRIGIGADSPALFDDLTIFRQETSVVQSTETNELLYRLDQNYPNPFNPMTTIRFSLPKQGQVTLYVFNVLGKKVATLVEEPLSPGEHQVDWSGLDDQGNRVSAGVYFYELTAGEFRTMRKMIFAK